VRLFERTSAHRNQHFPLQSPGNLFCYLTRVVIGPGADCHPWQVAFALWSAMVRHFCSSRHAFSTAIILRMNITKDSRKKKRRSDETDSPWFSVHCYRQIPSSEVISPHVQLAKKWGISLYTAEVVSITVATQDIEPVASKFRTPDMGGRIYATGGARRPASSPCPGSEARAH
jgi:hypothetical protein